MSDIIDIMSETLAIIFNYYMHLTIVMEWLIIACIGILIILHELFYNVYCKRFMSVTHAWTVSVFEVAAVSIGEGVPRGLTVRKTVVLCVVSN